MKPIKTLGKADDIVRLLGVEGALSPAEIAERIDMPRPSVYRLLDGLAAIGLTEPAAGGRAQLSRRWLRLADRARESMAEWRDAGSVLAGLVRETSLTAYLSVRREHEAVCVDWRQGRGIGVLLLKPGRSLPLNAGAAGRALLAFDTNADAYFAAVPERRRFNARTLVEEGELRADIAATRARGYSFSDQDVTDGIGAFGVPVLGGSGEDGRGAVLGVLSLSGIVAEVLEHRERVLAALREAAQRLGAAQG
ncbi:IclR family transcriptional regulator [Gulosibacter sp. 10]|uniref:IclR family transcriptional regulator n=1 Tax=Gulosibacter sp. 10 TaxID=1255570 RepID=UPI00097F49D2|nr:IclR family transcriptional regulator C-terminal domain-containing protein [Gulosibacter sp. 10]SJM56518.1 Transcriptional regulator, IclR family [Gulosibacter sp. 10]